jgi:hypothetical protein
MKSQPCDQFWDGTPCQKSLPERATCSIPGETTQLSSSWAHFSGTSIKRAKQSALPCE